MIEASPRPKDVHAAKHYSRPLEALAIYVDEPRAKIHPSDSDREMASRFLKMVGREPIVAIHPGSGSEKKNWPVENFAAVARWVSDELAAQLLVVEGEADERVVAKLTRLLEPRPITVASRLKLVELAAVLERCVLFLGNDSGITHIAAAVGTPVVAMFGSASPPIWEPRGERVRVVRFCDNDVAGALGAIEEFWGNRRGNC